MTASTTPRRAIPTRGGRRMTAADDRAEQIRARLAAATPGPWSVAGWHDKTVITTAWAECDRQATDPADAGPFMSSTATTARDADLIANAPADLAFLLAERIELLRRIGQAERAGAVKAWTRCVEWFAALRGAERVRNTVLLAAEDASPYENGADL